MCWTLLNAKQIQLPWPLPHSRRAYKLLRHQCGLCVLIRGITSLGAGVGDELILFQCILKSGLIRGCIWCERPSKRGTIVLT